ncbi:MAG: branched-chain amino acid ABC transporter permease [Gammaproteobacteria bacterium]|nr:branched-chain amino acid ABC transporter permease [Gammaproteobacteria bacterium]
MDWALLITQLVNGLQYGILLFLLAAGLTLVFGIMDFINLAHGSFYMVGAYFCATLIQITGSFLLSVVAAFGGVFILGLLVEYLLIRRLYSFDHLYQVLATVGLILIFDTLVQLIWGVTGKSIPLPEILSGQYQIGSLVFASYRLVIISTGLLVAVGLYILIARTRLGMLIRAGASNRTMASALGVNINRLYWIVFALGVALAGLAGMLVAPISQASVGMGNQIIIVALVVVIVGGIGSVQGAFYAALIIGMIDSLGRSYLEDFMYLLMPAQNAETAAPAISAMLIYIVMAVVLVFRPEGLFPPKTR